MDALRLVEQRGGRMTAIAARTLLDIRFDRSISAGAGWSRAASARLAGIGGVIFSMIGTLNGRRHSRNAPKRRVFGSQRITARSAALLKTDGRLGTLPPKMCRA
jgi:hypothetical protein